METVEEMRTDTPADSRRSGDARVQAGAYLLELSLDWIVLRASENIHHLLGESHVTLIDEPLGRFVHAQPLHDLRNLFSRLSGTTGIGRAYAVRLSDDPDLVDIAFHLSGGRVLLEIVPSCGNFGECFGSVAGLISGLASDGGQALLDNGARRMRALTGYDRVTLVCEDMRAESSRGAFARPADFSLDLPVIVADDEAQGIALFPRRSEDTSAGAALMRAPSDPAIQALRDGGIRAALRIPFSSDGLGGEFRCDNRAPREPNFELHAAAELFAQLFALRLEIDRLRANAN